MCCADSPGPAQGTSAPLPFVHWTPERDGISHA